MNPTRSLVLAACLATAPGIALCEQPPARRVVDVRSDRQVLAPSAGLLPQLNDALQELARRVSPAVVQIDVTGLGPADGGRANAAVIVQQRVVGAGVIVDRDGYIMTNAHVVENARRIRVVMSLSDASRDRFAADRVRVLEAAVVGSERLADLALLKVDATNLPTLRFSLDRTPQPGELVFAVGSPVGLRNSVTMGVISSGWRQPDPDNPMVYLQTDAPIHPGNSGGPLVDVTGAVVGLNTFVVSSAAGMEGLGFAIPARVVDFVYRSLREHGRVDHADIGAVAQTITPGMAKGLGLTQDWGVVIADVTPRGPAAAAGIEPGDVIVSVDGHPMFDLFEFTSALYLYPRQQTLTIETLRGSQKLSFDVLPWFVPGRMEAAAGTPDLSRNHIEPLGILVLDVDEKLAGLLPQARAATGVMVLGQARGFGSVDAGLRPGDVIHGLNRTHIESTEQLRSALAELKSGDAVVLQIERLQQFQYVVVEID